MPPAPKPTKATSEKARRRKLEAELERLSKELCHWRDIDCVKKEIDGGRCGNIWNWEHFIPQQASGWLVYEIGNAFAGCNSHNLLHHNGDPIFTRWYIMKFGQAAYDALCEIQRTHLKQRRTIWELEELRDRYIELLDNRPSVADFATLRRLGYYGEFAK